MPEIKVTVAAKLYMYSLRDPKMCSQTKFGRFMSNNIGFMLVSGFFFRFDGSGKVRDAP